MSLLVFCLRILLSPSVSQTQSFSEKRGARGAFSLCEQSARARMNIEGPLFKAVPETVRNGPSPQSALFKSSARMGEKRQNAASIRRDANAADYDVACPTNGSDMCEGTT